MKKGVLLLNLGTPDDTKVSSVRRYLREFLTDPRVIDLPFFVRYLLVFCAILPFRPFKTAKAYQKIWREDSPLRIITEKTKNLLLKKLGEPYHVEYAMRYGAPSIASVIQKFQSCDELIILPLFPQYSSAASGSAIEKTLKEIAKLWNIPRVTIMNQFYNDLGFINASSENIKPYLKNEEAFLLFSYHGLPERHIQRSGCTLMCDGSTACPKISQNNMWCYRAQCYETTRLIADQLELDSASFMTSFQSRLGKTPWIKPYTDQVLKELRQKGVENLIITSPAFVADCLETLEELSIQLRQEWLSLGGKAFAVIPCLNTNTLWIDALSTIIKTASASSSFNK
jgi:ferrochelatase